MPHCPQPACSSGTDDEGKVKVSNTQEWYPISRGGSPAKTNSGNYVVSLIQADNLWQLEVTNRNPSLTSSGDAGDPFPGSSNNRVFGPNTAPSSLAYNVGTTPGYNSFVTVSNISNPGPVMTADLYTRSPNSGPLAEWVNVAGVVPPYSGQTFSKLDAQHPVAIRAFPGASGSQLSIASLFITRASDGRWWNFTSHLWDTNATARDVTVTAAQQNGFTLGFQSDLPDGTNLVNGGHTFIVRVINGASIVTEIQLGATVVRAPEVNLSLADNSVVNTLTNFTAVAVEDSGVGIQRVEVALYYDGGESDAGGATRWYWSGTDWSTTPLWLGADFPGHPGQATLYYPIGPSPADLLTEHEYFVSARAVDAFGDAATNTISVFYDTGSPATIYWRYPSSGNWFDAANWTPARVPLSTDHVVVNAPGDYGVLVNGNATVASLRFGRVVGLDHQQLIVPVGGALTLASADTNKVYGRAGVDLGGSIGSSILQVSGGAVWNWTNGALGGINILRPGATMNIGGAPTKTLSAGAVLDNGGAINWAGPGVIYNYGYYGGSQATISNRANAVFNLTTDGKVFAQDYNASYFYNLAGGLLIKSGGMNSNLFNSFTLVSSGEVRVDTGEIRFDGTSTFDTGTLLSGNGTVRLSGTTAIKCPLPGTAGLWLEAGTLTATGAAAYTGSAGMDWTGGTLVGTFDIAAGSRLRISGAATKTMGGGATLDNRGEVTWSGPGVIYNYGYYAGTQATINNRSNAVFSILGDGQVFAQDYNRSSFNNQAGAVFRKTAGAGTATVNRFAFNNAGQVVSGSGALLFNEVLNLGGGGRLSGPGEFLLTAGTTTVSNLTTIDGAAVTMTGGTFFGEPSTSATLTTSNGGSFNWAGGTQVGKLDIAPGTRFDIRGDSLKTFGGGAILNNAGTVTWSGSGNIYNYAYYLGDRATLNNLPGAVFNVSSNAAITFDYNASTFNNSTNATFAKLDGGAVTTCAWIFNNQGNLNTANGTLALSGGGNSGGSFNAAAGAFLRFIGGTHSLADACLFTGAGHVQIDGATVLLNGSLTLGSSVQPLAVDLTSGTIAGSGTMPGRYTVTWTGGTIGGNQTITSDGSVIVTNIGAKTLGAGAVLNNLGVITWFGPGSIYNYGYSGGTQATINNWSNAVFSILGDGQVFAQDYNASVFNNLAGAKITKTAGGGTTAINKFVVNSPGEIRAETGSLLFDYVATIGPGAKLTGAGAIRLAGTVALSETLSSTANLRLEAGTLTGVSNATYTGSGAFDWTGGTIDGVLNIAPTSAVAISGAATKTLGSGAILNNQGVITWSGPGPIYNYGYSAGTQATINNRSGSEFIAATDGQVFAQAYNFSVFNNFPGARFTKSSGTNVTSVNNFMFNSQGEVRVNAANLLFDSVATFGPGANFDGAGTVKWAGGITLAGGVASTTSVRLEGGSVTGVSNATYSGTGPLDWTAGTLGGSVTIGSESVLTIGGVAGKVLAGGAVLNNQGTMNWSGPGAIYNYAYNIGDRAAVNNLGVFNIAADGLMFAYDYNPSFLTNAVGSKIRKTAGTGVSGVNYTFVNAGAVEILAGTFNASGTYLSSAATSELALTIGGLKPGTGFTRLTAGGNLPLAGTLKATLAGGFEPATGATFAILHYGSRAGQFSTLQLPPLSLGRVWKVDYGSTVMTLSVEQGIAMANAAKNVAGNFEFDINGPAASGYVIHASTNLVNWIPIQTNSPFTGTFHFVDPAGTTLPARFYRVLIGP